MNTGVLPPGEGRAYWVVGDLYTILSGGEDTAGAFALLHAVVPPGGGPPPHIHSREDEAFYVLDGAVTFQADGREFTATAGTWITLARGSLHSFRNESATPAAMLIVATPAGLERFFAEVGVPVTDRAAVPPPVGPDEIARLLEAAPRYGVEIRPPQGAPHP